MPDSVVQRLLMQQYVCLELEECREEERREDDLLELKLLPERTDPTLTVLPADPADDTLPPLLRLLDGLEAGLLEPELGLLAEEPGCDDALLRRLLPVEPVEPGHLKPQPAWHSRYCGLH